MDSIFRVFMFLFPFAVSITLYIWVGKKAWRVPNIAARIIAMLLVIGGLGYTLYKLVGSAGGIMTNDNFEYIIIIVTIGVLFFATISMALGEPEKPLNEKPRTTNEEPATKN